jgi:hypothetical protein
MKSRFSLLLSLSWIVLIHLSISLFIWVPPAFTQSNIGQCETPNLLILLDRSASMLEANKWEQAQEAIDGAFIQFVDRLRFGLLAFPWESQCGVPESALQIEPNLITQDDLLMAFANSYPDETGLTPLADSVRQGKEVLTRLADPNRDSFMILLTDGVETCRPDEDPSAPVEEVRLAYEAGYKVYVIGFGSLVSQVTLRKMAEAGGTNREFLAQDASSLLDVLTQIVESATQEECDLLDNDCDGEIDEGIEPIACETACGLGEKICVEGQISECQPTMSLGEECNNEDDDCDGYIDENRVFECELPEGGIGYYECISLDISLIECLPEGGRDPSDMNNPNYDPRLDPNHPDYDPSLDPNHPNYDPNGRPGNDSIQDPNRPPPEGCDGRDQDGDGLIDEGTEVPCENSCHRGRRSCVDGDLVGCSAPPESDESCNGYDDDCDGNVDEQNPCPGDERCGDEGICLPPCTPEGGCAEGFVCGADGYCESAPCSPQCDQGYICLAGQCRTYCTINLDCPSGMRCVNRQCITGDGGGTYIPNSDSNMSSPNMPSDSNSMPPEPTPTLPSPTDSIPSTPTDSAQNQTPINEAGCQMQGSFHSFPFLMWISLIGGLIGRLIRVRQRPTLD